MNNDDQVMATCHHCKFEILYGQPHYQNPTMPDRYWCSEDCCWDWIARQEEAYKRLMAGMKQAEQDVSDLRRMEDSGQVKVR